VCLWAIADELICQVDDTGHMSEPLIGRLRRFPDGSGGQGLWLIHELCDLVQIRTGSGGTQVRVHMQTRRTCRPGCRLTDQA
jgi:hypothetical protein